MLLYLCDLIEVANDFAWFSAKASYAFLLCEMEHGALDWKETNHIGRIFCAHAQRHTGNSKQNWTQIASENVRRPWFCKPYQNDICSSNKDHEVQGELHKHICAHCLVNGRHMNHAEKNGYFVRKTVTQKTSKYLSKQSSAGCNR